jgi:hypothetical protein
MNVIARLVRHSSVYRNWKDHRRLVGYFCDVKFNAHGIHYETDILSLAEINTLKDRIEVQLVVASRIPLKPKEPEAVPQVKTEAPAPITVKPLATPAPVGPTLRQIAVPPPVSSMKYPLPQGRNKNRR